MTDATVIRNFYVVTLPDGTETDQAEDFFGQVEAAAVTAIRSLVDDRLWPVPDTARTDIARWAALQYLRVPWVRQLGREIAEGFSSAGVPVRTISGERAQTLAAKVGTARKPISAGLSGFHRYVELSGARHDRWGAYAMSTWQKLTFIGEYDGGTTDAPLFFGGNRNLWAAFAELDYRLSRGINVRGKFDYLEPDKDASGDLFRRWLVEADFVPVPFTELKLSYRNHNEETIGKYQEYLAQFFFPF